MRKSYEVQFEIACPAAMITRPEMKDERVSYDAITLHGRCKKRPLQSSRCLS
jgi:hypothetical protein